MKPNCMQLIMEGATNEAQQQIIECLIYQAQDKELSKEDLKKVLKTLREQHKSLEVTLKQKK